MPEAKYKLHATRVDRIAVVDRPAVPDAEIVVYKREDEEEIEKGATTFQNLPLADRNRPWDAGSAMKRVQKWAGGPSKETMNWTKFRKAFLWYDSANAENITAYKLPYADVINGTLTAVPRAIIAAVQRIRGTNIPTADKQKVLAHCKKYYQKMDMEFPEITLKSMTVADFNARLLIKIGEAAVDAVQEGFWRTVRSEDEDKTQKLATIKSLFVELKSIVKNILLRIARKTKADGNKFPKDQVVRSFGDHLSMVALERGFSFLKFAVVELSLVHTELEEPEETIFGIIDNFESFAEKMLEGVLEKGLEAPEEIIEKEGRKISAARLRKLKEAIAVLQAVIEEAEAQKEKSEGVISEMDLEQLTKQLEELLAEVKGIATRTETIEAVLKEHKMLLTDEEKAEAEAARQKQEEEAETEKARLEKEAEEKAKADEEAAEAEKKAAEEQEARLKAIEDGVKKFDKVLEEMEKKYGIKSSLDVDSGDANVEKRDVFAETLRAEKQK